MDFSVSFVACDMKTHRYSYKPFKRFMYRPTGYFSKTKFQVSVLRTNGPLVFNRNHEVCGPIFLTVFPNSNCIKLLESLFFFFFFFFFSECLLTDVCQ